MSVHLNRALEKINRDIMTVSSKVEEAIQKSIVALINRRADLAREVVDGDDEIDRLEVVLEEECLEVLALHQPVAADLRFVISLMKVNNDLERMGDLAVNIADRAMYLSKREALPADLDFSAMADLARRMVRSSLDSLITLDPGMARAVIREDDELDAFNRDHKGVLMDIMRKSPEDLDRALQMLYASRHLERVGDLAVNIAEDVIFMVEGTVIRHKHAEHLAEYSEQESQI